MKQSLGQYRESNKYTIQKLTAPKGSLSQLRVKGVNRFGGFKHNSSSILVRPAQEKLVTAFTKGEKERHNVHEEALEKERRRL